MYSQESAVSEMASDALPQATRAAFIACLTERGYAQRTLVKYQAVVSRFSHWLDDHSCPVSAVSDELIEDYLKTVSPATRAKTERAALHRFIAFIDSQRETPADAKTLDALDQRLLDYEHYLVSVCGLAPNTCRQRLRYVETWLRNLVEPTLDLNHLCASALINYISDYSQTHKPGSTRCLAKAIGSYLRFEQLQGELPGSELDKVGLIG